MRDFLILASDIVAAVIMLLGIVACTVGATCPTRSKRAASQIAGIALFVIAATLLRHPLGTW